MIHKRTRKPGPNFVQRWQLARLDIRKKKRADRAERRAARPGDRPSLTVTIATIALSVAVAIPSQLDWFLGRLAHGQWSDPNAWRAVAMTLLVEVLCWLGAILYARSMRTQPVRLFRIVTFLFAGVAAAINYDHGREISTTIGVVSALGSLMGVGAFELYMHRARHAASGMPLAEMRLWALRWRRHPLVMRAAAGYRAVHGPALSREAAWKLAWVAKHGAPEVPVPTTDPRVLRLLAPGSQDGVEAEPTATDPASGGVAVAERGVLKLPLGWSELASAGDIVAKFWPELPAELGLELPTGGTPGPAEVERRKPRPASSAKKTSAPEPTSAVPVAAGERNSGRKVLGGLVRNSAGSGRVQFPPTSAELAGDENALTRIGRYLGRAEADGQALDALDRKYIATQFGVSDRQVRNSVKAYNAAKAEGK
jgi:hypothetical protein